MSKEKIWLSSPHMGESELKYIHQAFKNNWIAPLGPNVDAFEEELSDYLDVKHAAALSSGTAAIHLALKILGVEAGDGVICQSMTFAASANPIIYVGAVPIFIDSEPETWNMSPELLEIAIKDRIKKTGKKPGAIIVVHLYGMMAKMSELLNIARKYEIPVIEDAAEALGSNIAEKKAGSWGDIGILSFNGNKIITTSGGGALVSEKKEYVEEARFLATQARDDAPHYQHSVIGYNYRMSNILAGIGRGQLEILEKRVKQRRNIYESYFNNLGKTWLNRGAMGEARSKKREARSEKRENDEHSTFNNFSHRSFSEGGQHSSPTGIYFLKEPEGYFSNRWLTTIIINPEETGGVTREDIRVALAEQNIEARPLWKPMHRQPVFAKMPYYGNGISDTLFEQGLCLPSGSNMSDGDLERVITGIKDRL